VREREREFAVLKCILKKREAGKIGQGGEEREVLI
jgi:hypothetical protein